MNVVNLVLLHVEELGLLSINYMPTPTLADLSTLITLISVIKH